MLSSVNLPKTKNDLVKSLSRLSPTVKFTVVEANSPNDKRKLTMTADQYLRNGPFSVIFIESPR